MENTQSTEFKVSRTINEESADEESVYGQS